MQCGASRRARHAPERGGAGGAGAGAGGVTRVGPVTPQADFEALLAAARHDPARVAAAAASRRPFR